MLNLLFISDSPKAEYIKKELQPVLKVIIDVVTDFDHGLKDVFEKRPTTVCIQDQIGGVTGDSVARHIQMLLGNSAPSFILLHTANTKARAIKGLYEHLIDLNQPDESLHADFINTLKSLLGEQWERIFIPPKSSQTEIMSAKSLSAEPNEEADKLVDDILSDLETSGFSIIDEKPVVFDAAPVVVPDVETESKKIAPSTETDKVALSDGPVKVQRNSDEMAELLLAEVSKAVQDENRIENTPKHETDQEVIFTTTPESKVVSAPPLRSSQTKYAPADDLAKKTSTGVSLAVKPEIIDKSPISAAKPDNFSLSHASPTAEFKISKKNLPEEEHIPEDLLLAFEENYRSRSRFLRLSALVVIACIVCAGASWYFVKQKPAIVSALKQRLIPSKTPIPTQTVVTPSGTVQNPHSTSMKQTAVTPYIPTFIPVSGLDSTYAAKNPGWERYAGNEVEFRTFTASGRIQAVQVISKETAVSEILLKSVLTEFAGSSKYQITSRSNKAGTHVENGVIQNKADLIIYKKNGIIKAFVVSLN
jgi:hypothetical protein